MHDSYLRSTVEHNSKVIQAKLDRIIELLELAVQPPMIVQMDEQPVHETLFEERYIPRYSGPSGPNPHH